MLYSSCRLTRQNAIQRDRSASEPISYLISIAPNTTGANVMPHSTFEEINVFSSRKPEKEPIQSSFSGLPTLSKPSALLSEEDVRILEIIKTDEMLSIDDMIRNGNLPTPRIMEAAIKECGHSNGVLSFLRELVNMLKKSKFNASSAWCGYRLNKPEASIFVVNISHQKCIPEERKFNGYEVVFRREHIPSDEETMVSEMVIKKKASRVDEMLRAQSCIRTHAERLMQTHSNLSIIEVSPVKASGYKQSNLRLIEQVCIVLYVPVKGIIPVGEKAFESEIDGIPTDVREGEFVYFGKHNAHEMQHKLKMGCMIRAQNGQKGTLGGFVDLPDNKIGFITSAHVVLAPETVKQFWKRGEGLNKFNKRLKHREKDIYVYQHNLEHPIGRVYRFCMALGNKNEASVETAVIEITDDDRKPDSGEFPLGDFKTIGFTNEDRMVFNRGEILEDVEYFGKASMVIKYGSITGITRGCLDWNQATVRSVNMTDKLSLPVLYNQLLVKSADDGVAFAEPGDSGALVFLCVGGNLNNLQVIGIVTGGYTNLHSGRAYIVTPIKAIFDHSDLQRRGFKCFPNSRQGQKEGATSAKDNDYKQNDEMESIRAKLNKVEEHLNKHDNSISELNTLFEERFKQQDGKLNEMKTDIVGSLTETMRNLFEKQNTSK